MIGVLGIYHSIRDFVIKGAVGASAPMLFKLMGASTHTFQVNFALILFLKVKKSVLNDNGTRNKLI